MLRSLRIMLLLLAIPLLALPKSLYAESSLHERIDALVGKAHPGPWAAQADDAEFLRRIYLDLAGFVPPADITRAFLADASPDKRTQLIDRLLAAPDFADRMAGAFSVMLLERRDGGPITELQWRDYLRTAFHTGRTWDEIAREILSSDGLEANSRPAMRFFVARGANNYDLLTRDLGRLFLGMDLQCAQCHDHPSINDYKQAHYFGILAFVNQLNTVEAKDNKELLLVQKGLTQPVEFKSVFTGTGGTTGPQLPGLAAVEVPVFAKPEEAYEEHPRIGPQGSPKFNVRAELARELTSSENRAFAANFANRLWAMIMGRGLVVPLDLQHASNPPSNPELLELLTQEVVTARYDLKLLVRELTLTKTYQRSSLLLSESDAPRPETFAVANMKPLSAEQLMESILRLTGQREIQIAEIDEQLKAADEEKFAKLQQDPVVLTQAREEKLAEIEKTFLTAFANPPGEPEDDFNPTLSGALFFDNVSLLNDWLGKKEGNLVDRLVNSADATAATDELYLSILARLPSDEERSAVIDHLTERSEQAELAWQEIAWGLLASSEFRLNH